MPPLSRDTDTTGGVSFLSLVLGTGTFLLERSSYGGNVTTFWYFKISRLSAAIFQVFS